MKKIMITCAFLVAGAAVLSAMPTYYGLSGMTFLPDARITRQREIALAFRSVPARAEALTIHPLSLGLSVSVLPFMELGLTNTYRYYLQNDQVFLGLPIAGSGFNAATSNIYAPIIPSVKLSFLDEAVPNGAIAIGFLYPLGTFFCFDYRIPLPADYCLYFVFGIGSTINTLTPFGGVKAELPFGVDILLEGAYSGMVEQL
ncbi:MAG: hypothetical protein Q8M76_09220, partial [Spirochaetaceae bacterium]|nr:hypothetical protein [Spirochaetaceae bacterium]